jgi:hypothetical protein
MLSEGIGIKIFNYQRLTRVFGLFGNSSEGKMVGPAGLEPATNGL